MDICYVYIYMRNKLPALIGRLSVALAACLVLSSNAAVACSCASKGSFLDYANQSAGVIQAKVVRYGHKLTHGDTLYASMVVQVVAVIAGDLEHDSLALMGDPGFLCMEYVDSRNFVIGQDYLIALHGDEPVQPFGGCGEAWVKVNGKFVEGHVMTDHGYRKYSLPMAEVIESLKSN